MLLDDQVLDADGVAKLIGACRSRVNSLANKGLNGFPRGRKIGSGGSTAQRRWLKSEILAWVAGVDAEPVKKKGAK